MSETFPTTRAGAADPRGADAQAGDIRADMLIVGGGLVGLSLALACGRAGLEVAVVDRDPPARQIDAAFDGRTSALAFGSQRILAGIGLWPAVAAAAEPIREIRVADAEAPLFLHYDHRSLGPDPLGFIVENRILRRALMAALPEHPPIRHFAPAAVVEISRGQGVVVAILADGRRVRAALAVAADGRGSMLRREAGIKTVEWSYPQAAIVCTVGHARPHCGVAVEHFLPAGPFAMLPMTGNRSSIVWTEKAALAPGFLALDPAAFRAAVAARFGGFLGDIEILGPRWSYPLGLMLAENYRAERLALIGEAAHVIHPIAGQGLNLGLRDVAVLAELVADRARLGLDIGAPDLLRDYERWRRFDGLALAAVTDGLNRLFSNSSAPLGLLRSAGLGAVNRIPPLKRFFMLHAMGLVGTLPRLVRGEAL